MTRRYKPDTVLSLAIEIFPAVREQKLRAMDLRVRAEYPRETSLSPRIPIRWLSIYLCKRFATASPMVISSPLFRRFLEEMNNDYIPFRWALTSPMRSTLTVPTGKHISRYPHRPPNSVCRPLPRQNDFSTLRCRVSSDTLDMEHISGCNIFLLSNF